MDQYVPLEKWNWETEGKRNRNTKKNTLEEKRKKNREKHLDFESLSESFRYIFTVNAS